jgi:FAD/FMN-containing dehydrogenase
MPDPAPTRSITCPVCHMTSWHPMDVAPWTATQAGRRAFTGSDEVIPFERLRELVAGSTFRVADLRR